MSAPPVSPAPLIPVAEALDRLFALVPPARAQEVALSEAGGRILLGSVRAGRDQPPFDASAMDGYALRAADAQPGARLRVIGESPAGRRFEGRVGPGEAVRILTGAPLPAGADGVVMQEDVRREGDALVLGPDAAPGHVRPRGGDFAAGAMLDGPRRLRPADVALLAAFGHAAVPVARRPEVAILSTGDELVMPGEAAGPDQVFASNALGLAALVAAEGGMPRLVPIAGDAPEELAFAFSLAAGADLIVTIGGASVGDRDLVAPAARAAGADLAFHKVAMRPGKPLLAGRMPDGAMLLGLPGNPVSALVCGAVFLAPVLRAMLGLSAEPAPRAPAPLAAPIVANGPREHYQRAVRQEDGAVRVQDRQDSSLLWVLAGSDGLVVRPPGDGTRAAGELVQVIPL